MNEKLVMFAHAGSKNHGCEAIVRSTIKLLGKRDYLLVSKNKEDDIKYRLDNLLPIVSDNLENKIDRNSLKGYKLRLKSRFAHKDYDLLTSIEKNKKWLFKDATALSIGGDNYCYLHTVEEMREKLNVFSEYNNKRILWGCSLNDNDIFEYAKNDIKKYDLITVRETLSYDILQKHNMADKAILCADPAFQLDIEDTDWGNPDFSQNPIIGINLSALMKHYEAYPNAMYQNFKKLCDYVINNTEYNIAFIPHVVHEGNNDLDPTKKLADEISSNRILVVDDNYNCMQLKSLISKCDMFIGCRTHATIAAYSTNVPTLVMGYSTKARGIAKDIFGTDKGYVLPTQDLKNDDDLTKVFMEFLERKDDIKNHLESFMPEYKKRSYLAVDAFNKFIK